MFGFEMMIDSFLKRYNIDPQKMVQEAFDLFNFMKKITTALDDKLASISTDQKEILYKLERLERHLGIPEEQEIEIKPKLIAHN